MIRVCSVVGCDRDYNLTNYKNKNVFYCIKHYRQIARHGGVFEKIKYPEICVVDGCKIESSTMCYCKRHYAQILRLGYILTDKVRFKKCDVNECKSKPDGYKKYCKIHQQQINRNGELVPKEFYKNTFIISKDKKDVCILLRNRNLDIVGETYIDFLDLDIVKNHKWCLTEHGYAWGRVGYLHQLIMSPKSGNIIDHINRDKLNNRRINLRETNQSINSFNSMIQKNNKSGVVGVYFDKKINKWIAQITKNRKMINLGSFINFNEAIKIRKEAELKYFGELR